MSDIIACPGCGRRLRLPADIPSDLVRCPSCRIQFPIVSASDSSPLASDSEPAQEAPEIARPKPLPSLPPVERLQRTPARKETWIVVLALVGLVFLVAVGGLAGVVFLLQKNNFFRRPVAVRPPEDEEQRLREVRQAFADHKPLAAEEIARELRPLFDELGAAYRAADGQRIMAHFDLERMADEFIAAAALPLRSAKDRSNFVTGMRSGMERNMAQRAPLMQWTTTDIRQVKKLNNLEAVVIVRHTHTSGAPLKMRWWVTRQSGAWKVYDLEDLDVGVRSSTLVAALLEQGIGKATALTQSVRTLQDAFQTAIAQQDVDGAERKLKQIDGVKLPNPLEGLRYLITGIIHLRREQWLQALAAFTKAGDFQPDMPILDFMKGVVLNRQGEYAKAQKHLQAYRELLGEDSENCREMGEALCGLRRFSEAARLYRRSLDFNPKDADAFLGLLHSLGGDDNKDDVGTRFAKLDNPRDNFLAFAEDCEERQFPQLLQPLVTAMRKIDPKYPALDHYEALVQARTGHAEKALALFRIALAKETNAATRRKNTKQFLLAMASSGKSLDAYTAAPDARAAFRLLAAEAKKQYRTDQLRQLVTAHCKKYTNDPLYLLYQADIHTQDGRYPRAEKTFAAALAQHPDEETLKPFRANRVLARYHTGQALSAYRDIGPRQETFLQLASLCLADEDNATLAALLDAHAKNDPKSDELSRFRYRLKIRQNHSDEAIALFRTSLALPSEKEKRRQRVSEFLTDMRQAGKPLDGYQATPDTEQAFQLLAEELLMDDQLPDLRRLIELHRGKKPDDPWLAYYQAELLLEESAWAKAADALGAGMKKVPKDNRYRFLWPFLYASYKSGRAISAYEAVEADTRKSAFGQLVDLFIADKKAKELKALIDAHRKHAADDPDLFCQEARACVLRKQPAEAIALLEKALKKQTVIYTRRFYLSRILPEMAEAGLALEGYRVDFDKSFIFDTLAGRLLLRKKDKELAALLEEHGKKQKDDPRLRFYQGELHLLRNELPQAEQSFAEAAAKAKPSEQWRYRYGLRRAQFKSGKIAEAYRAEPNTQTFESLAYLCFGEKDARQLQILIDSHRKTAPADAVLVFWELKLRWLKQDYSGALRILRDHDEDVFHRLRFRWEADDYRVRCLIKLKRLDEAIRAAEAAMKNRQGNRTLLVLARASTGNVGQTIAVLAKRHPPSYELRGYYQDVDLGPILRSEAFREFRHKYPEPKDKPWRGDRDED